MFGQLIATLKKSPKTIVFTEGTDPRILEASARLLSGNFLKPVLVGNPEEIAAAAEDAGFNIRGAEIADPANYPEMDAMVEQMVELRKGKMTPEQCRDALKKGNYFGTMLVKMGVADCLLGGATYSTADTVRPALQLIKTRPGSNIVSSCFIMVRPAASGENEVLAMADCAINIKPTEDELVEICRETVECAKIFGVDPKVAFLSYSTLGSGKGEDVDKMRNACEKAKAAMPDVPVDGEFQFDAAVSPVVAKTKHITSAVGGHANTFIFPDINAGNIGYKIAQRLGGFEAYGPILQGLAAPINDLSRGCNADEVYKIANPTDDRVHYMLPTAEAALASVYRDEILTEADLPKKFFAYTPCFRREAGSHRADERGMVRGHQFNKVEMFQYTTPEGSDEAFEELVHKAENLVAGLGLHFRTVKLAAGDCSASMARTYDIEILIPSMNGYKEVSSVSNARDYQARRGNIRFRRADGKIEYVHTLNGSGLATSRIFPAIVEQNQRADGSVVIPEALRKYLGGMEVIEKK